MPPRHPFQGTETLGVELFGVLPRPRALELAGAPLALDDATDGHVRASVLAIVIEDLGVGLPILRFTYPELLWLLHLRSDHPGERLAVRAHTTLRMMPALSLFDRYATERARIRLELDDSGGALSVESGGARLEARATTGEDRPPATITRLLTRASRGGLFEIPWQPHAPARTRELSIDVADRSLVDRVFGPAFVLERAGLAYWARRHGCGPATRLAG